MKAAFIIAEYNPFHNGHRYHIEQTRSNLAPDYLAVVMSGNFVQRGDIAVCDKFLRAEAAVRCGADLVVELPVKYAVSNASRFAFGAIETIRAFGIEGFVSFGASVSINELAQAAVFLSDPDHLEAIEELSKRKGKTFPSAFDLLLREKGMAETADCLKDANNVLAVEYLRQIGNDDVLRPFAVKRSIENAHNAELPMGSFANAAYLRSAIYESYRDNEKTYDPGSIEKYIPENAYELIKNALSDGSFPVDRNKYDAAAYSRLLTLTADDLRKIDNVNQGLENRIVKAIVNNSRLSDAVFSVKSKRHTMSRLRQIFTSAVLGVTKEDAAAKPSYLRVLAFNEAGRKLLSVMRDSAMIPIASNLSDVSRIPECRSDVILEYNAEKLFDLCLPVPLGGNRPFESHAVYIKNSAG